MLDKSEKIAQINRSIVECTRCRLHKTRTHAIPHEGNIDSDIVFIGQSPGKVEDKQGKLFVGPSGEVLDRLFGDIKLNREKVYITNFLKCILPKSRKPRSDEIQTCTSLYLFNEINLVKPKVIIPLGYHATKIVLKHYQLPVPNRHHFAGLFGKLLLAGDQQILPLRHPATIVHNSADYSTLLKNYKKIHIIRNTCKWYHVCPVKTFYDEGKLPKGWIDKYCKGDWSSCIRYQLEEDYMPHPDNMLPNGTIDYNL